jgi:hypothetical protein
MGQHLRGSHGEQGEIVLRAGGGVGQLRSGLDQRQRQIPQGLRDPPRFIVGQLRGAAAQQCDRLTPVEDIYPHRSGQLRPARVTGSDHHVPTPPGQVADQSLGFLSVVEDHKPPVPLPQRPPTAGPPPQSRDR